MIERQLCQQIQADFVSLSSDAIATADCFYQRLFEINPGLIALFDNDMTRQGEKLMKTLGVVVHSLDQFETLKPVLRRLGQDHTGYGVKAEYYVQVKDALLWMLEQRLGERFDRHSRNCWKQLYDRLAAEMQAVG